MHCSQIDKTRIQLSLLMTFSNYTVGDYGMAEANNCPQELADLKENITLIAQT